MDLESCYRVLELEPGASPEAVKSAYREMVQVWHPDRFTGNAKLQAKAEEKLKRINLAYERLRGLPRPPQRGEARSGGSRSTTSQGTSSHQGRKAPPPPPPRPEAPPPRRGGGVGQVLVRVLFWNFRLTIFAGIVLWASIASLFKEKLPTQPYTPRPPIYSPPVLPQPKPVIPATKEVPYINSLGMKFVPVPGTKVLVSVWETRVRDYVAFTRATSRGRENPGFPQEETHPVVKVSWEEAKAFCEWLCRKEKGLTYRLPTDHEWSCAVGIGDQESPDATPESKDGSVAGYPWGLQYPPPGGAGNYDPRFGVDAYAETSPAGGFPPNRFGVHDIGGNVWEWCEDWYNGQRDFRVVRGGAFFFNIERGMRSSCREPGLPGSRSHDTGFRCVLELSGG